MAKSSQPPTICPKCLAPLPEVRDPRMIYCTRICAEVGRKRRQRGLPVCDRLTVDQSFTLAQQNAQLLRDVQVYQSRLLRSRATREVHKARARSADGVVRSAQRQVEVSVVRHAGRTVAARKELTDAQARLQRVSADFAAQDSSDIDNHALISSLEERLATGNAAYAELLAGHQQLRDAFDSLVPQARQVALVYRQWDLLCLRLYKSSRGMPTVGTDQTILATWGQWRQSQKNIKGQKK